MTKHPDSSLYFYQLWSHRAPDGLMLNPKRNKARSKLKPNGFHGFMTVVVGAPLSALGFVFGIVDGGGVSHGLLGATCFTAPLILVSGYTALRSPGWSMEPRFIPLPEPVKAPEQVAEPPKPEVKLAPIIPTRSIEMLASGTASHDLHLALTELLPHIATWAQRRMDISMVVQRTRGDHLIEMMEERCREMQFCSAVGRSSEAALNLARTARSTAGLLQMVLRQLDAAEVRAYETRLSAQCRQIDQSMASHSFSMTSPS